MSLQKNRDCWPARFLRERMLKGLKVTPKRTETNYKTSKRQKKRESKKA